jgi:aspartate aminotransferase
MGSETHKSTFFTGAQRIPPDRIFELTAEYLKDDSPVKANLGQGAYRDGDGNPWILPSVRESRRLLQEQGLIHEYLPILGHAGFREAVARTVLGEELFSTKGSHVSIALAKIQNLVDADCVIYRWPPARVFRERVLCI